MKKTIYARINPKVLKWAREESKYTLEEVSEKARLQTTVLVRAEAGEENLTLAQFRKVASIYDRPMAAFYLKRVPESLSLPDFRMSDAREEKISKVIGIIREFKEKRKFAEELSVLRGENFDFSFVGKFSPDAENETIRDYIIEKLNLDRS